jgi:hypothetical protein
MVKSLQWEDMRGLSAVVWSGSMGARSCRTNAVRKDGGRREHLGLVSKP